jgi:hypothetical protein
MIIKNRLILLLEYKQSKRWGIVPTAYCSLVDKNHFFSIDTEMEFVYFNIIKTISTQLDRVLMIKNPIYL